MQNAQSIGNAGQGFANANTLRCGLEELVKVCFGEACRIAAVQESASRTRQPWLEDMLVYWEGRCSLEGF